MSEETTNTQRFEADFTPATPPVGDGRFEPIILQISVVHDDDLELGRQLRRRIRDQTEELKNSGLIFITEHIE